jgi:MoxR-like ATPase
MALKYDITPLTNSLNVTFTRAELIDAVTATNDYSNPEAIAAAILRNDVNKVSRGVYSFYKVEAAPAPAPEAVAATAKVVAAASAAVESAPAAPAPAPEPVAKVNVSATEYDTSYYIPKRSAEYVGHGYSSDVETIIGSGEFFNIYISGPSGNGKTFMVEQACAKHNRAFVRVQIGPETDEDQLIGGMTLVDGNTVFEKGPVIKAMEMGAVLLLDEVDRGSNNIMCLQGIMEGKPFLIKKTGEVVYPKAGFTVISTANTNGRGSEDGRYSAATLIDDAFLERFAVVMDQGLPSMSVEKKILFKHAEKFDLIGVDEEVNKLANWLEVIRTTWQNGGIEEIVSTRRACHIMKAFAIFKDLDKAVKLGTNRYDEEHKTAFLELWEKLTPEAAEAAEAAKTEEPAPF